MLGDRFVLDRHQDAGSAPALRGNQHAIFPNLNGAPTKGHRLRCQRSNLWEKRERDMREFGGIGSTRERATTKLSTVRYMYHR